MTRGAGDETAPAAGLLQDLPDAILLVDGGGSVLYANAAAERLFGSAGSDLVSRVFSTLFAAQFETECADVL